MQPPDRPYAQQVAAVFDADWYRSRYPDIAASGLEPLQHFLDHGLAENRDPNRFFECDWYNEHYPDVAVSLLPALLHYLQSGAEELRHPSPRFDAAWYVEQHPDAALNPVLYHLRVGSRRGYLTERPIDIADYLPSRLPPLALPNRVFADVVILVHPGLDRVRHCIQSVLADRALPLGRIIVIDDRTTDAGLTAWLKELAADGHIHLIRNRRHLGFAASAALGMQAAETHDVVLLHGDTEVPVGWLGRLAAHAYAEQTIATVSPLCNDAARCGYPDDAGGPVAFGETPVWLDGICQAVNSGRSVPVPATAYHCMYIRRSAEQALGGGGQADFCARASAAGWSHRVAGDVFVCRNGTRPKLPPADGEEHEALTPLRFAVTAALCRDTALPVILMISHAFGGGVQHHINALVDFYRDSARVLLLTGTDRGVRLSVASLPEHPDLILPAHRLDDLVTLLRSMGVSRVHIHHLLNMDLDVRRLIHRLDLTFDVTVHDYFGICPQINLLRRPQGFYCGEPGPASCNACIAEQASHGARDIVSWRQDRAWLFRNADRVICPSEDAKQRLDRYGFGGRALVVPHEILSPISAPTRLPRIGTEPLRIALLGIVANHKGARVVAEVMEAAKPGTIELHLIGDLEADFPADAARLISVTGRYQDENLAALLTAADPHVVWFPAVWPETFSYTLSAAIAAGLPIVATDIGSLTERLAGRPYSWLVDGGASADTWLATFAEVRQSLRERADPAPAPLARTIPDFYRDHYLSHEPKTPLPRIGRKCRVAIVPERLPSGALTPSANIRLLQPFDHPGAGDFDVITADAETIFDCEADIIVTHRLAIPDLETANRLAAHASRLGAKLLYDFDEDLLANPNGEASAVARRMLTLADAVWVSTPCVRTCVATIRPDAVVVESRLDERLWARTPAPDVRWDNPIRILCMGDRTHDLDFAMIQPALLRLKDEYDGLIAIDVIGMTSHSALPEGLNRIVPPTQASRSHPGFVNWLTSVQPRWHIGLAPLLDTPGNAGASPVKALEYAALGLAGLASDTPVYRGSIADGPAGQLVANDAGAWHAALDWLIRNQTLRQSLTTAARAAFFDCGTLAGQAKERRAALAALLPDRGSDLRRGAAALTIAYDPTDPVTRKRRPGHRGR